MLCSLVHNIYFSCRRSCFVWRDSVNCHCCSEWKHGSHSGTAISYKWFGFQFTFFYCNVAVSSFLFSFHMDCKSWGLFVPFFSQWAAYVDRLGRSTPGVMLSRSRLPSCWICWINHPLPICTYLWTLLYVWLCYRRKLRKDLGKFWVQRQKQIMLSLWKRKRRSLPKLRFASCLCYLV